MNTKLITDKINGISPKKILCFSLLSPLNSNKTIQSAAAKLHKKVRVTSFESKILDFELKSSSDKITFISFPLSSNTFSIKTREIFTLFDYDDLKRSIPKTGVTEQFL